MIRLLLATMALAGPITADEARKLTGKFNKGDKIQAAEKAIRKAAKNGGDAVYFSDWGSCSGLDALTHRGFSLQNYCNPSGKCDCIIDWGKK